MSRELHDSSVARRPVLGAVSQHLGQRLSLVLLQRTFALLREPLRGWARTPALERGGSAATPARSVRNGLLLPVRLGGRHRVIPLTNRMEQRSRIVTGHCITVDKTFLTTAMSERKCPELLPPPFIREKSQIFLGLYKTAPEKRGSMTVFSGSSMSTMMWSSSTDMCSRTFRQGGMREADGRFCWPDEWVGTIGKVVRFELRRP